MITGERGIGKTSLMLYLMAMAKGVIDVHGKTCKFLVLDLDLDKKASRRGFMERIKSKLDRELGNEEKAIAFLKKTWSFLSRIKIMDSGLDKDEKNSINDEMMFDDLATSLSEISNRICKDDPERIFTNKFDGILILIDEADGSNDDFGLGEFLKLLLEKLQRLDCSYISVGIFGLPTLKHKLYHSHPSSVRIFNEITLERLESTDIERIIDICIQRVKEKGHKTRSITSDGKNALVRLSEGFPHFLHQFGYTAYEFEEEKDIDQHIIIESAFMPKGGLSLIGDKYYHDDYYNKIKEPSYRQVLKIMADSLDGWVKKSDISKRFVGKKSTLDNAIKALRDKGIILDNETTRGVYKLLNKGFALWVKLYGEKHDTVIQVPTDKK
jgi:hypothetical protein